MYESFTARYPFFERLHGINARDGSRKKAYTNNLYARKYRRSHVDNRNSEDRNAIRSLNLLLSRDLHLFFNRARGM